MKTLYNPNSLLLTDEDDRMFEWEYFTALCSYVPGRVAVTGYFMAWNGKREGGKIYDSLADAVTNIILEDSTPIFTFDDKKNFVLDETHHDAPVKGNHYEFRIITERGEKWLEKNSDASERTKCETLFGTKGYSKKVPMDYFDCEDEFESYRDDTADDLNHSYSYYESLFGKDIFKPIPKTTGYLEKLNNSDTLVVHPKDKTTDMLAQIYEGKGWDVLTDRNIDTNELHSLLSSHKKLIFLGHGTSCGMGGLITDREANLLQDKKIFAIWCNADKYFKRHGIGDGMFITKNVPSEAWEARAVGFNVSEEYMLENITYWSKCCANVVDLALNGEVDRAVRLAQTQYQAKYGPKGDIGRSSNYNELGVTRYNTDAIQKLDLREGLRECIEVKFDIENSAFRDEEDDSKINRSAIADRLRKLADKLEETDSTDGLITDINGNTVGSWRIK